MTRFSKWAIILTWTAMILFGSFQSQAFTAAGIQLQAKAEVLQDFESWLPEQVAISKQNLLKNINPLGTVSGVVVASPQKDSPNYFRHWIRDAALVMNVLVEFRARATSANERKLYDSYLEKYVLFSLQNQDRAYFGEPIFEVNGEPFLGPWGRPQNDGPALRAVTLAAWAKLLLSEGKTKFVREYLYDAQLPARTVIKRDLEFISQVWADPCFDLWEEVKAHNFYTMVAQRAALKAGSELAQMMNDQGASDWYLRQSKKVDAFLENFFSSKANYVISHVQQVEGLSYKNSNLDVSVVLALLHVGRHSPYSFLNSKIAATHDELKASFANLYAVNRQFKGFAPAIGRYPEDRYAGNNFDGGNPWVLTTAAMAEYNYVRAIELLRSKKSKQSFSEKVIQAKQWIQEGDQFLRRVQLHANPDGSLSEQIDRWTGFMTSARDLTWSYAGVLTANFAREQALQSLAIHE